MLALLKNNQLIRTVDDGVSLTIPQEDGLVVYVSPALAGWSHSDFSLVQTPPKPETPENCYEVSSELILVDGELRWNLKFAQYDTSPSVPEFISDRQFFQILANRGLITKQEALAAVTTGTLPAAMEAMVSELPEEEEFNARMLLQGATEFFRAHPLTDVFGAGFGMSAQQLDQLWIDGDQL